LLADPRIQRGKLFCLEAHTDEGAFAGSNRATPLFCVNPYCVAHGIRVNSNADRGEASTSTPILTINRSGGTIMAIHAPITGALARAIPLPPVLAFLMGVPVAPRDAVERVIQAAIDALDLLDGDTDMEDDDPAGQIDEDGLNTAFDLVQYTDGARGAGCPISDPGGGNVEDEGQMGAGQDYYRTLPVYGVDQTQGPINHEQIVRVEKLIEMERDCQLSGQFEQAKKIVARLKTLGHPAMSH
jgi:hypothetical protein